MNLYYNILVNPLHGVLTGLNQATGEVTYTKDTGYLGADSYTLEMRCGVTFETSRQMLVMPFNVINKRCADALEDEIGSHGINADFYVDVSANDITCDTGVTTWQLVNGTVVNLTVNSFTTEGVVNITPLATGPFSFQYNILCDGIVHDTGSISGTAVCIAVSGGTINGVVDVISGSTTIHNVEGLVGSPPYTYNFTVEGGTIISGQGTSTITIQWN